MKKNNSNSSKQTYSFIWKNIWLLSIFLLPLIYTITTYYMSYFDSYFIDLLSPISSFIEKHWKVAIWVISIIFIVQWNSCISFIKNIVSLFIKTNFCQNISDGNDGYLCDEDFGKKTFAYNILQIINNFHSDDNRTQNLVIGLDGKWGSGKTFVIKKIKEILNEGKFPDFHLFSFQPWLFAKNTNYINAFMDKLNSELIKLKCGVNLFYLSAFKDILDNNCGIWGKFILFFINKSDEELKEIIQQRINHSQKKFLVVIDDLDRLASKEILEIFKLIRCVANFENMYFILCLDRKLVENNVQNLFSSSENDNMNLNYCDKIINIYFEIPIVLPSQLLRLFNKLINQDPSLKKWKEKYINETTTVYANKIISKYASSNIRDIKILLNKLKALSMITYPSIENKNSISYLSDITNFYAFWALETLKKYNMSLYLSVKDTLASSTIDQIVKNPFKDKDLQEFVLNMSLNSYIYFVYNDGNIILSLSEYQKNKQELKNNLNYIQQMDDEGVLNSFFEKASQDHEFNATLFNNMVNFVVDYSYENLHFNKFFESHIEFFDIENFFKTPSRNKESIFYLINKTINLKKFNEFINTYAKIYQETPNNLPFNNLIFYIDFKKYTSELYGILFNELIYKNIDIAPGLLDLLNKFIEQTNGDMALWTINIIKRFCNLTFPEIINKLENDYTKAKKTLDNYKLEKRDLYEEEDNYYQNVVTAYEKIIEFVKKHEEEF